MVYRFCLGRICTSSKNEQGELVFTMDPVGESENSRVGKPLLCRIFLLRKHPIAVLNFLHWEIRSFFFPQISEFFMMKRTRFFDLENHFAFYGAYHSNRINMIIHMLCVWPIVFTALLLFYFTPSFFDLPPYELSVSGYKVALVFNVGFLFTLIYSVFYVRFDPRAGFLASFLCFLCWVSSSFIGSRLGFVLAYKVSFDFFFKFIQFLFRKFDMWIYFLFYMGSSFHILSSWITGVCSFLHCFYILNFLCCFIYDRDFF